MSVLSEQSPSNPQDPSHYAPRKPSERSELRLSAISSAVGETAFERPPNPGASRSLALNAELEHAVYESLRRQMDPLPVPEPANLNQERSRRRGVLAIAGGIVAAVGVSAVVALLFVTLMPGFRDRDANQPFLARTASSPESQQVGDDGSKPALDQFRSALASTEVDQSATREKSERLLEQFMQWRQKTKSAETAR
jgi:hypothetical protein